MFFVNRIPFLVTRSRRARFITAERLLNRRKASLATAINKVINFYKAYGYAVRNIFTDGEFECLRKSIGNEHLDTMGHNKHVGDIKRLI